MSIENGGINAVGVRRSFGSVEAVRHIDFDAPPGEVTALIGPNGSGKTTLLLILASLLRPDSGTVRIGGLDPQGDTAAVRRQLGWMPDTLGVWESLTAREILTTVGALYGLEKQASGHRADDLLGTVGLTDLSDQPARVLSRGQQQRLSMARCLMHNPAVLLLDEPASGLDPASRVELRVLLRQLAAEGKTVVVSSHVLSELDEIADRAVFISGGRSVKSQTLDEAHSQGRRYAITSPTAETLLAELNSLGLDPVTVPGARRPEVTVLLNNEVHAAEVLRTLVLAGVVVSAFAPAGGALEETYMSLNTERR